MSDSLVTLLGLALVAVWIWVAIAVGKAAAKKNRRRWLWTFLAIFPLGPILGALWLATLPVAGEKATTGQIIGRSVLIFIIVLSQLGRLAQIGSQVAIQDKAEAEFGFETESRTTHYKQMDVNEIVVCLQLSTEVTAMRETATREEGGDTYLFESQREVDIYNTALEMNEELECDERTYEYADLDKAMELIEGGEPKPIRDALARRFDSVEARIARWNEGATTMVDDATRFDGVALRGDDSVVHRFTLVEYNADEVSQSDLREFVEPLLISGSCSDAELSDLREQDYTLTWEYRGRDGGYIGKIDLVGPC